MRAGSSSMVAQQSLTPDASAIIKQALTLARHRGHAQVTPFHVAITLLSLPNSLLRSSCFHSHSQTHPLRTRALDLCFNVALNRLPSSSSSSTMMLGSFRVHSKPPSLSNALMATFKRAQAHQRRGSDQQMMVNAVRIDVEQLIMSILDDPSISRVMKEAGFVSAQVKAYIEKVSPELNTREVRKSDKSLDLNLNRDSNSFGRIKRNGSHGLHHETTNEVVYSSSSDVSPPSSSNRASALPPWLLHHDEGRRTETSSNKVSVPNSNSSTDTSEVNYHPKFNELNAENLKILCDSLLNISCRKETVSEIASTILKCRSGINRRNNIVKEDTWLFFLGIDTTTKQKIARELAAVVFGSNSNTVSVSVSNISCQSDYFERLVGAIQENPHRIFLLEDIDKVDYCTQVAILNAVASGSVNEDVGFSDAVVILSCESFDLKLRTKGRDDGASNFDLNRCAENDQFDSSFDSVGLLEAVDRMIIFDCFNDL